MQIQIKRVYDPSATEDGIRILVDRLWPRGLRKENADIDLWLKDIAPSAELRTWFGHDPKKWTEFQQRYIQELESKKAQMESLRKQVKKEKTTLVYAARDVHHNNARVLLELLRTHPV